MAKFSHLRNAMVFAFPPPAVVELGRAGGFDFQLQDRGGLGHEALMAARNQMLGLAAGDPQAGPRPPQRPGRCPQYRIDVDWEKAGALGVPINAIHHTISASFGSAYVNDFIQGGRVKRVYAQADAPYRMLPRTWSGSMFAMPRGQMTPFTALRHRPLVPGTAAAGALQQLPVDEHLGGTGPRGKVPGRPCRPWRRSSPSSPRASVMTGPASPFRSAWPSPGPAALRLFHYCDFSLPGGPV
jgi:hypothetical protein